MEKNNGTDNLASKNEVSMFGDCKPKHLSPSNRSDPDDSVKAVKKSAKKSAVKVSAKVGTEKTVKKPAKKSDASVVSAFSDAIKPKHLDAGKKSESKGKAILKTIAINWRLILTCIFALTFCISATMLIIETVRSKRDKSTFDELAQIVAEAGAAAPASTNAPEVTEPAATDVGLAEPTPGYLNYESEENGDILPEYRPIYEMNSDFFAWIKIEGTDINYPVMYTPEDPEYYLHKDFHGSYSSCGVPFMDARCPADGNYYLIYGHHMKNKTMFGQLPNYEDSSFFDEHRYITFDTLYEHRTYEVVACFYTRVYGKNDTGVFKYYDYGELTDEAEFNKYIELVRGSALYDTGVDVQYGDDLLVLSTCAYHTTDGRFVVVARHKRTINVLNGGGV